MTAKRKATKKRTASRGASRETRRKPVTTENGDASRKGAKARSTAPRKGTAKKESHAETRNARSTATPNPKEEMRIEELRSEYQAAERRDRDSEIFAHRANVKELIFGTPEVKELRKLRRAVEKLNQARIPTMKDKNASGSPPRKPSRKEVETYQQYLQALEKEPRLKTKTRKEQHAALVKRKITSLTYDTWARYIRHCQPKSEDHPKTRP